jgi:hypothetical protein
MGRPFEFQDERLKPLQVLFSIYLQAHLLQAKYQLGKEWQAQDEQLKAVERSQRKLQATAKAIAQQQQAIAKQRATDRKHARRLNNKRFARWLDNTAWALRTWATSSKTVLLLVALHWVVLFPGVAFVGLRFVLDGDRCIQSEPCRFIITWVNQSNQPKGKI